MNDENLQLLMML